MKYEEKRLYEYQTIMNWLFLKNMGISLVQHPAIKGKRIAVYGMGQMGNRLMEELVLSENSEENTQVVCAIDKSSAEHVTDIPVFGVKEEMPEFDICIVSVIWDFQNIQDELQEITKADIISLESIVGDLKEEQVRGYANRT